MEPGRCCLVGGQEAGDDRHRLLQLGRQAQEAAREGDLDGAIERIEEFLELDGADRFWGLGLLQTLLGRVAVRERDPDLRRAFEEQQQAIGARLLALEDPDACWAHAWERARQHNQIAWEVAERAADRRELLEALEHAEQSVAFWPYFFSHQDTRVRLLLRLGRMHEAFATAHWVRLLQPDWPELEDVWQHQDYRAWEQDNCCTPELPPGPASRSEVVTRLGPRQISAPATPLNPTERAVLRRVRVGEDEWHRARNCALLAVLLDGDRTPAAWLETAPQQVDLSRGVILAGERDEIPLAADTRDKLRHWLLYAANNHPAGDVAGGPPGIRAHLFLAYDLEGLTTGDLEVILDGIGRRLGLVRLRPARFRKDPG